MNEQTIDWPFIGNNHALNFLSNSIKSKKLAQTYILQGLSNVGKTKIATHFAKILLCESANSNLPCDSCSSCQKIKHSQINHPDLYVLKKPQDKKNISIIETRELIRNLNYSSFKNSYKIGIIKSAHHLNNNGFNALLKTLEEPKKQAIIILTTSNISKIPKTIISRAQTLHFKPVNQDLIYDLLIKNYNTERAQALNLSRMCLGKPAIAIKLLQNKEYFDKYNSNINTFISFNNSDIVQRFQKIQELLPVKISTEEGSQITSNILNAWLALARDCLMLKFSQTNYVQHSLIINDLNQIEKKLGTKELLNITSILQTAKTYLRANVSPKNTLEYVAINI